MEEAPTSTPQSIPAPVPVSNHNPSRNFMVPVFAGLSLLFLLGGGGYWSYENQFVYTDKALVQAPLIQLTAQSQGILKNVLVKEGEALAAHQPVARVGSEMINTEIPGLALVAKQDIGAVYQAGQPVVTMIDPRAMRIVARIEEDKGLKDVHEGQAVIFTVDAYGSQQFNGLVEKISQVSREGDVVFSISDKREQKEFDITIVYDFDANPVFRHGMSAKVWIVKNA